MVISSKQPSQFLLPANPSWMCGLFYGSRTVSVLDDGVCFSASRPLARRVTWATLEPAAWPWGSAAQDAVWRDEQGPWLQDVLELAADKCSSVTETPNN